MYSCERAAPGSQPFQVQQDPSRLRLGVIPVHLLASLGQGAHFIYCSLSRGKIAKSVRV